MASYDEDEETGNGQVNKSLTQFMRDQVQGGAFNKTKQSNGNPTSAWESNDNNESNQQNASNNNYAAETNPTDMDEPGTNNNQTTNNNDEQIVGQETQAYNAFTNDDKTKNIYYIDMNNDQKGPLTLDQFVQEYNNGNINDATQVFSGNETITDAKPLSTNNALKSKLPAPPKRNEPKPKTNNNTVNSGQTNAMNESTKNNENQKNSSKCCLIM
mmetsp:Transcript_64960/g.79509  ORF Transcript_64960/g.79509 Transcript_64960/m.79509 type:complete len:214 (+) Transcript_64960:65-706(+)